MWLLPTHTNIKDLHIIKNFKKNDMKKTTTANQNEMRQMKKEKLRNLSFVH